MGAVVIMIILAVIAVCGVAFAVFGPKTDPTGETVPVRWIGGVTAAVAIVIGLFVLGVSTYAAVGTSDTAVVTSFGHTDGDLGPGIHFIAPWKGTTVWDHSVQRTTFEGSHCLQVRIFGGQTACLPTVIQWQANPTAADKQFQRYRTFLRMQAAYMSASTLVGYFNNQFENFNPITVASLQANGAKGGTTVSSLVQKTADAIRAAYAGQISIERVTVGTPQYTSYVDGQLGKVVGAKAGLEVAQINEQTAQAEATAAKNLTLGNHLSPLAVLQNCIDTVKALAQANESTSQTFNCNLFGTGAGASVLLGK